MNCKNCGLPIKKFCDPWGHWYGEWYHPTIERETNIDGADVRVYAFSCNDDLGKAEPTSELDVLKAEDAAQDLYRDLDAGNRPDEGDLLAADEWDKQTPDLSQIKKCRENG
jgi:hypothetical protein